MSLILSVLICLLSIGIMAGRVYEILSLTDSATGFLITKGIALNPVLLAIFVVITICCGVIIFGGEKNAEPFFSKSSGIIAAAAGVMLVVFGTMQMKQSVMAVLLIVGGAGWFLLGVTDLGKKIKDGVIVVLLTVFVAALCLDIIIFDVYSIYYTEFMHRVLSHISVVLVILAVLKNVYAPSRFSKIFLYVSGFICFAFSGMLAVADIICIIAQGTLEYSEIVKNMVFFLIGIYALDNALSLLPKGRKTAEEADFTEYSEQADCAEYAEKEAVFVNKKTEEIYVTQDLEKPAEVTVKDNKEKMIFKGDKLSSAKNEKIVYKKPKN